MAELRLKLAVAYNSEEGPWPVVGHGRNSHGEKCHCELTRGQLLGNPFNWCRVLKVIFKFF